MDDVVQIIPYYAHPHVHVVINDNSFYSEDTSTPTVSDNLPYATAIVTGADQGIDNTFVRLQSLKAKANLFGYGNYKKYGQSSIQADVLFNGYTDVWFMRVLPDNATYANMILLAKYRKSAINDDKGAPTGKSKMDVKFEIAYAAAPKIVEGAKTADDIMAVGESYKSSKPDPVTGYMTMPLFYVRSIGRGNYGNQYSVKITRDSEAEKEYGVKTYDWSLIANTNGVTAIKNIFAGSLYQTTADNASTLISDVLDGYSTGSCPVDIYPYENNFMDLFDFYQSIVEENGKYLTASGAAEADMVEYQTAADMDITEFDPLFGLVYNTKTDETIPYYKNYTAKNTAYKAPDKTVDVGGSLPLTTVDWSAATVGATCLVVADANNGGLRWLYTVIDVDGTGNIVYDSGVQAFVDDDQYDGVDITSTVGIAFQGGSDGDFESISVNGEMRAPTDAEMKLLIAKEQVKAFRGTKDRKILSPARVNLDFIFDANYNMTVNGDFRQDDTIAALYNNSSVLTDADYRQLATVSSSGAAIDLSDINVKQALYDLNEFRNRNGMTIEPDHMAGCLLHLDCGVISSKSISSSSELLAIIDNVSEFKGRNTSVDLGYYEIFDPYTGRREAVTATYFIAKKLIPHLMKNGLNKPFVNTYAQLTAVQRDNSLTANNDMIRGSFKPDIDLIDWDVKESLYNSRINYYITTEEGRIVQRACQNTRQTDASALLEENNVRVLNTLKKGLEKACRSYLYNWNEPETRKGYTDTQMQIYRPWIGTMVEDIDIRFEANEFETKRMMMHCYCDVKFRNIAKRIILEIGIQRNDG